MQTKKITREIMESLKHGDPVARLSFFVNLTFVKREDGKVYLQDSLGEVRFYSEHIFMKYGRVEDSE